MKHIIPFILAFLLISLCSGGKSGNDLHVTQGATGEPTLLFLSAISGIAFSQGNLEVEVTGIRNSNGFIMLQLLDSTEKVVRQAKGVIVENKCILAINDLKPGKYAIRYFHDENLNGVFEKNKLGIPIEGYGFSNNAYGLFGPESFKKWLFDFEDGKKISLKIKY